MKKFKCCHVAGRARCKSSRLCCKCPPPHPKWKAWSPRRLVFLVNSCHFTSVSLLHINHIEVIIWNLPHPSCHVDVRNNELSRASDGDDPMKLFCARSTGKDQSYRAGHRRTFFLLKNCGIRRRADLKLAPGQAACFLADAHKDRVICSLTLRCSTFSAGALRYCKSQVVICTQTCHLCTTNNIIPQKNSHCQMAVYNLGRPNNRKFFRLFSKRKETVRSIWGHHH
jgi:hypothetical protein